MRIAFVVVKHPMRGGGIETLTYHVGRNLVRRGHEVVVYTMGHYGEISRELDGISIERVPCIPGPATERLTASLQAVIRATSRRPSFDVIHLHTPMTGAFGAIPRVLGYPTVLQMHGVDWQRSRWGIVARNTIKLLERIAFRTATVCTAVSMEQCQFYRARYGGEVLFIPTGTDLPTRNAGTDAIESLGLSSQNYVLTLARLVPEKGVHYLINAFRKLRTTSLLAIAGSGDRRYESYLRELATGDERIRFLGYVEGDTKSQLLSHARLFVQPSEIEGLSISLLEAMSYGLCCLSSNLPANREAAGSAGVYFRSKETEELSRKLEQLLEDEETRMTIGESARQRVSEMFSWDKITDTLQSTYESILTSSRSSNVLAR